jgi:hypothetical protein
MCLRLPELADWLFARRVAVYNAYTVSLVPIPSWNQKHVVNADDRIATAYRRRKEYSLLSWATNLKTLVNGVPA